MNIPFLNNVTVTGLISTVKGTSTNWNSTYTTVSANSASWISPSVTGFVRLSGDTMTGALSTTVLSANDIFVQGILSTIGGTSDNWNSTSLAFAASDESSNVTTGNNKILFTIPYNFVLTKVKGGLNRAATGSSLIFSLSSQTNDNTAATITIPANNLFADSSALTYNLNENDRMCINITQVGSTQPGIGLKIYLIGRFK